MQQKAQAQVRVQMVSQNYVLESDLSNLKSQDAMSANCSGDELVPKLAARHCFH